MAGAAVVARTSTAALVRAAEELLLAAVPLPSTGHRHLVAAPCSACDRVAGHALGMAAAREQLVALVPRLVARILQAEAIATAWRGLAFVLASVDDAARTEAAVARIEAAYRGETPNEAPTGGM